jgi:exodeoxyribonuclease-1
MTFYFYDLETTGFNPRTSRIMQFAGQRTDMDLAPIGKPDNVLIKITPDVLPDPDAILVTGITPQKTLAEGITEAEFIKQFDQKIYSDDTIFVGYNNIRFDDEFMRFLMWRNFYDPYEWHWKNGCGRWDLLDVVRMTRALRPEGLEWPVDSDGKASNRLALLSSINKLNHSNVHDALSDVQACIALAQLVKTAQPKLFKYLLDLRDKKKVAALVEKGEPLIYTSGRYSSDFAKTTIAVIAASVPDRNCALMYDLRTDPTPFLGLSPQELAALWQDRDKEAEYFPVKQLSYNKSPALAPLSVLDKPSEGRIKVDMPLIQSNLKKLIKDQDFEDKLLAAFDIMQTKKQVGLVVNEQKVDELLYDGFVSDSDRTKMRAVRAADIEKLNDLQIDFEDGRLKALLMLYKARNYPKILSKSEKSAWDNFRQRKLLDGGGRSLAARYYRRLEQLKGQAGLPKEDKYLIEELNLYGQSVLPQD